MTRHWWKWMIGVIGVPFLVWGWDRGQKLHWVGVTDLEIEFAITDAMTGKPIPNARVEVESDGGHYEERDRQQFVLSAGPDGVAHKECRQSMCFGTRSGLGRTDTFAVHLPWWRFRVAADGHESGELTWLDTPDQAQQVHRAASGKAILLVPVKLHKKQGGPRDKVDGGA